MKFSQSRRSILPPVRFVSQQSETKKRERSYLKTHTFKQLPLLQPERTIIQDYGFQSKNFQPKLRKSTSKYAKASQAASAICTSSSKSIKKPLSLEYIGSPVGKRLNSGKRSELVSPKQQIQNSELCFEEWSSKQEETTLFYMKKYSQLTLENVAIQFEKHKLETILSPTSAAH